MLSELYKDYFSIDPKYYPAVNAELIRSGRVKWDSFYPHETFVNLLEKIHIMLSGKDSRSLWVEGAYGVGKSHAVLTAKSLLEVADDEVREYFQEYGLSADLCQKLITDRKSGQLITVHRIGSSDIRSDRDLIVAVQESVSNALREHHIENRGEISLREAALKWLEEKDANRNFFNDLIHEEKYAWDFGGRSVDEVIDALKRVDDPTSVTAMMKHIMQVADDNGITALRLNMSALCNWIKNVLDQNRDRISAIVFFWDEFTEYFKNNQNSLTGFQELVEISQTHPFFFLIVTHESKSLISDKGMQRKIMNRFIGDGAIRIEIPENIAFKLLAQAMKLTEDPVLRNDWLEDIEALNDKLADVRKAIIDSAKKHLTEN